MYKNKNTLKTNKKRYLLVSLAVTALIAVSIILFLFLRTDDAEESTTTIQNGAGEAVIKQDSSQIENQSPPEDDPKRNASQSDVSNEADNTSNQKRSTDVVITDASQYGDEIEVRAFMPAIVESGICTITFTKNAEEFIVEEAAYADATTTICTNSLIERDMFASAGEWTVSVSYESNIYFGISEERTIEIQ